MDLTQQPNLYNIKRAQSRLVGTRLMPPPVDYLGGEELNLKEMSIGILNSLGCTFSTEEKDYSLLKRQTDKEVITNENIIDMTEWVKIENESIFATDKFINVLLDPFYKLDDDLPHRQQNYIDKKEKKEIPDSTILTSDVVLYNTNPVSDKLKQFKFA